MIKATHGQIEMNGSINELLADLSCVVDALYNGILLKEMPEEEAEKRIRESFELGLKDDEELSQELNKKLKDAVTELAETLVDILKGKGEE